GEIAARPTCFMDNTSSTPTGRFAALVGISNASSARDATAARRAFGIMETPPVRILIHRITGGLLRLAFSYRSHQGSFTPKDLPAVPGDATVFIKVSMFTFTSMTVASRR